MPREWHGACAWGRRPCWGDCTPANCTWISGRSFPRIGTTSEPRWSGWMPILMAGNRENRTHPGQLSPPHNGFETRRDHQIPWPPEHRLPVYKTPPGSGTNFLFRLGILTDFFQGGADPVGVEAEEVPPVGNG